MSAQYGKLISLILLEHFGEVIETIASCLFRSGPNPLSFIVKYTELPLSKVKLGLCVLIKQGFVVFKASRNEINAEYELLSEKVLLIIRYPKYLSHLKKLFGDEAEMLLEELLINGYAIASDLIQKVQKRATENRGTNADLVEVRDKFVSLVTAKYVMRYPLCGTDTDGDRAVPVTKVAEAEMFKLPVNLNVSELAVRPDAGVYWCVNFDRFHQDFRDRLLVAAIGRRIDDNAAELIRVMLQQIYVRSEPWTDVSNPVPLAEIQTALRQKNATPAHGQLTAYLMHYLTVLEEDQTGFVRKVDDSGSGQYVVHLKDAVTQLCWATIDHVVLEKFHTKAARIFRLIRTKQFIEPDQIQQLAMIPAKEAKRFTYQLLEANFIQMQELRKAPSNQTPNKSFTLFHVDVDQVVRMTLELCYKSLHNAIVRRHHNKQTHKRVIDKKHRVDTIFMSLKVEGASVQQLKDIEEMITPPEKEILEKIGKMMKTLNMTELEIDDTIFLFQLFCNYSTIGCSL